MADPRTYKEGIAEVFSRTSATHDSIGSPLFAHFGPLIVDLLGLEAGERVLDVAAGTGASLFPASRRSNWCRQPASFWTIASGVSPLSPCGLELTITPYKWDSSPS